jgi:K(+)-stimulated pyrophosphate-energized sodium pump
LKWEYIYISVFLLIFSLIIFFIDGFKCYTMIAFILGAITSLLSGYIGMAVATSANARVTFNAAKYNDDDMCYRKAFNVAYRGGMVMGFCLVSLALFVLLMIIIVYQSKKNKIK